MKKRYDQILESVVHTFLQSHEPVSSAKLKETLPFQIAPATIRYYFNKMVEKGELAQLHKSSGRIPTDETMKRYWRRHLPELDMIADAMEEVARVSEEEDLFLLIKPIRDNRLLNIEKVGEKYLILVFKEDEYVIRYHPQIETFLNDLKGYQLEEVKQIARDVGMMTLYQKMRAKRDEEILALHPETLIRLAQKESRWGTRQVRRFLEGDVLDELPNGLYFDPHVPKGYMIVRTEAVIDDRRTRMLCMGSLDRDYTKLFKYSVESD